MLEDLYDALDAQDKRDYKFSDFEEYFEWEKKKFPYDKEIMFDQEWYPACTRYSPVLLNNGQNILEYAAHGKEYKQVNPLTIWLRGNKIKSIQEGMKQLVSEKLIRVYLRIDKEWEDWIRQMELAIDMWCYINSWSSNWDREKIWKTGVYCTQNEKFAGHARWYVDYDRVRRVFIAITSFGPKYGKNWYFEVPYDMVFKPWMYSKNAIVDVDNSSNFVDPIEKQRAKEIVRNCKKLYESTAKDDVKRELKQTADFMRNRFQFTDADL